MELYELLDSGPSTCPGRENRYLLFGGSWCYPEGGWNDHLGTYSTSQEAIAEGSRRENLPSFNEEGTPTGHLDWWHVIDSQTGERVEGSGGPSTS